jgi:hypothetical protein
MEIRGVYGPSYSVIIAFIEYLGEEVAGDRSREPAGSAHSALAG